jgi:hypothetical protein
MSKDRIVIPGIPTDAARVIIDRIRQNEDRLALLERTSGRPGVVSSDTNATVGEFLNIAGRSDELITIILPEPTQARRNARVTLAFRNEHEVRIVAIQGTVNGAAFVLNNLPGTYDAICDGLGGWAVQVGVTEEGVIGTPGVPGALAPIPDQRVLGNDSGVDTVPTPITVHQELDWIPGAGTRWVFDGVDDRADFGNINSFERTNAFSLGAWTAVVPAPGAAHDMFVKFDGTRGFSFYVSSANKVGLFMTNGGVNTLQVETTNAIDGAPHQVVATYDGSSAAAGVTIYVDGVSVALTTVDTPITATIVNAANFAVGGRDTGVGSMFAGVLFETAAWSAALTPTQVLETYGGGLPPDLNALSTAPDPVFWAKFDGLDAIGANGIINYGTGAQPGTAEGGLAPAESGIGGIPVRATNTWGLLNPGAAGLPLVSNGSTAIPSYQQLSQSNTGALTGDVTKAAGSSVTAIAAGVIVDADVNASAAIAQTKLGATTGFSVKASGANATTSAEPIVTYSASANMSAERVTTSSTSVTVSTSVANQIEFQRAALTGDVTASANSNTTAIAANAVTNTQAADMAQSTVKGRAEGAGTGDPADLTPTQVIAIIDGESPTWTGAHNFTGASHTVNVSGAAQLVGVADVAVASSTGGLWLSAGHTPVVSPSVSNGDVLINASNGAGLFALATPTTNVGVGDVELAADGSIRFATNAVERLEIEPDGAWQLGGDQGDSGEVLTSAGSSAPPTWQFPRKRRNCCEWNEDFFTVDTGVEPPTGLPGTNINFGSVEWVVTHSGSAGAAAILPIAAEAGHPGIVRLETGATSGNTVTLMNGGDNGTLWVRGDQVLEFEVVARMVVTTTAGFFIGLSEDPRSVAITGVGNSNIIGFFFDTAGAFTDTTIHCITREADGTASDTDSGVAPSGGWQVFTIRQTALGTVEFLIDDAVVATHSTQVPDSETMNTGITCITRTGSARQIDLDYVSFTSQELDRTAG